MGTKDKPAEVAARFIDEALLRFVTEEAGDPSVTVMDPPATGFPPGILWVNPFGDAEPAGYAGAPSPSPSPSWRSDVESERAEWRRSRRAQR